MAVISDPGTVPEPVAEVQPGADGGAPGAVSAAVPAEVPKWYRLRQEGAALITYLLDSQVHTFAFSVAANAILSFIPLAVLLYTLAWRVFHSQAMVGVVFDMMDYFLPSVTDKPHWVATNIQIYANIASSHGIQAFSLIMILISCTGIFLPLEVALNQAWGVKKSRNYLMNQLVAFGLAILMVVLGMIAIVLSAGQRDDSRFSLFPSHGRRHFWAGFSRPSARVDGHRQRRRLHCVFLLRLLAAAQLQGAGPAGDARLGGGGTYLAGGAVYLRAGAAAPRSEVDVRAVLCQRRDSVLGLYLGTDSVRGGAVQREATGPAGVTNPLEADSPTSP